MGKGWAEVAFWMRQGRGGLLDRDGPGGLPNEARPGWPRKLGRKGRILRIRRRPAKFQDGRGARKLRIGLVLVRMERFRGCRTAGVI